MQFQLVFELVVFVLLSIAICAVALWLFMVAVSLVVYVVSLVLNKITGKDY